jgi:hypothetical protein
MAKCGLQQVQQGTVCFESTLPDCKVGIVCMVQPKAEARCVPEGISPHG